MAKEIAITKYMKISEAQQYMIAAVLGASVVLGVSIALISRFTRQISFNTTVIMKEEESIANYSAVIEKVGICKAPKGSIYSDNELKSCDPNSIEVSDVPGTLRANIINNLSANEALYSVTKEEDSSDSSCINPDTGKSYTYKELNEIYDEADTTESLQIASNLIKSCSALRVIPDALPASQNNEALMASLNKLFLISNWEPEALSPSHEVLNYGEDSNMKVVPVSLMVEADSSTTLNVLDSIEHSIREFDITNATIEWGSENTLIINASANTYYITPSSIPRYATTISEDSIKSVRSNSDNSGGE